MGEQAQGRVIHRLAGVHPTLIDRLMRVLAEMERLGHPMMVTDGVRTLERQQELYAQGRETPGKVVTDCDGVVKKSNHQVKADGFGHAVDCAFIINGQPNWGDRLPWETYGALCLNHGLKWGIKLANGTIDRPHIELPLVSPQIRVEIV